MGTFGKKIAAIIITSIACIGVAEAHDVNITGDISAAGCDMMVSPAYIQMGTFKTDDAAFRTAGTVLKTSKIMVTLSNCGSAAPTAALQPGMKVETDHTGATDEDFVDPKQNSVAVNLFSDSAATTKVSNNDIVDIGASVPATTGTQPNGRSESYPIKLVTTGAGPTVGYFNIPLHLNYEPN